MSIQYQNKNGSRDKRFTHGLTSHLLYNVHRAMIARCYHKKCKMYKSYGKLGVIVCKEWRNNFILFFNWCIENGWQKGMQIDRFPNNAGNYDPSNCRIATPLVNARNKRGTINIMYNNEIRPLAEWVEALKLPVSYFAVKSRLDYGWSVDDAFFRPKGTVIKNKRPQGDKNPRSKLTNSQVIFIVNEQGSMRALAKKYGVCHKVIMNIKHGKSYKQITNINAAKPITIS